MTDKQYTVAQLVKLADDLMSAILDAAWLTADGRRNLSGPTPHMKSAIDNYQTYADPRCSTCGKSRREI